MKKLNLILLFLLLGVHVHSQEYFMRAYDKDSFDNVFFDVVQVKDSSYLAVGNSWGGAFAKNKSADNVY